MKADFKPLFCNPHLATIAGNYWKRAIDESRFPGVRREYPVDSKNTIVVFEHQPDVPARGQVLFLHGLEGSADAGYIASCAQEALTRGFAVHRVNMRTCGGTEDLCETMYHSGLTGDMRSILLRLFERGLGPSFLVGFSLGGNVVLKLAGELGETNLAAGLVAVSTPIDLAACVRRVDRPTNYIYARRFLDRLKDRIRRKSAIAPGLYNSEGLDEIRTIWEFDDRFTAPHFGFGTAMNYYATQSAIGFLDSICIPALVIAAKDDPLVPVEAYDDPVFQSNPALELLLTEHGGHLGFLARTQPRFWLDPVVVNWLEAHLPDPIARGTPAQDFTSV